MKKVQLFVVIFIIVIMISSVIGFVYTEPEDNNSNSFNYKGFKFILNSNSRYQADINGKLFIFDYLPNELINIELPSFDLDSDKYYLLINYTEKDQNLDYNLNKLGYSLSLTGKRANLACINEQDCDINLPVKNCEDNSFYFKKSNLNKIYLQDKCIVIESNNIEMSKLIDKLNLKIAGIE